MTNATPPQSTVETAKSKEENTALPPEPVLPSPPAADQAKLLEHLRGLRQGMGTLPPELEQKLRDLEDKMGGAEAKLNHGHLNKMQKVQKQVTGITEKIRKLDQDWQTFVAQVEERFHKHKGLFLETRAKLVLAHRQKVGRAGHYQGRDLPCFSVFDECPNYGRVGRPRHRRQGADIGGPGRLPGHGRGGRRNRGADQIYSGSLPEGRSCDLTYQSGKGAPQAQREWKGQTRDSEELTYGTWDEIETTITVPVSCCVQDVFSGLWSWVEDDELHYTKDNSDLRSGAQCSQQGVFNRAGVHVDHPICMNDTLHFDVHNSAIGVERCMQTGGMTLTFVDNGSDTELALGETGANDASIATTSRSCHRQVRFNPQVEVCEFEPHFEFLAVDDVLPSIDSFLGDGVSTYHFTSEADDAIPPPVGDDMVVDDHGAEEDVDDDAYVVFHGFGVLETSTAGMTVSSDEPLRVITYGIHGVSLGRRDTWVTTAELHHLKQRLWELWEDAVPQFATCWAFAVRPQPLFELQVARAWDILVEIDPSTATPPGFCAALLLMCNEQGAMFGRPLPKLVREDTTTEAMIFQHPHSRVCVPDGMRECKLMVEGSLQAPHAEVHVRPGALSKLLFADATPAIQQAQFWYPDAEQMAVEALAFQRSGLETFQLVLHEADRSPREFDVGISAFTTPMTLRSLLPADLRHSRLHWIPLRSLHPSFGVWRGRFHLVVGATTPGPTRPLMVVTCRATESYCELWHHEVRWMPHGISMPDFVSIVFSDLDEQARSGIIVCHNQAPIESLDGLGAGSVVTLYHGRSMSSEGYDMAEEDDDTFLMQARAHGAGDPSQDYDPSTFSAHVVLQNLAPIWRGCGPARDVFQRRSLYLLNHDLPAHQLFSWSRLATPLWNGEYYEVDVLIQYPRPLGAVDIVVEFVDMALRQRLEEPVIFRVLVI